MKKLVCLLGIILSLVIVSGCAEISEDDAENIKISLNSLNGSSSVIMKIETDISINEEFLGKYGFDVYINKARSWTSLQMLGLGDKNDYYQDYRFVLEDKENNTSTYYEYKPDSKTYSKNVFTTGKDNYVFQKSSQGEFDLTKITFSLESIINMVNAEALSLKPIISEDEDLETYNLYELTFDLNYFIENDRTVLDALYGLKVSEQENLLFLNDIKQTVILGYEEDNNQIKYFSYSQKEVLRQTDSNFDDLIINIFVLSIGEEAENEMVSMEESDIFPNESNTEDN